MSCFVKSENRRSLQYSAWQIRIFLAPYNTIQNKEICYACHAKIWKSIILATQKIKEIPEPCHAKDVKNPFFLAVKTCNKFLVPAVPCNKSYSMSNLRNPKFLYCNSLGLIPAMKNMHETSLQTVKDFLSCHFTQEHVFEIML